jgi:hypothetical protein
MNSILMWLLHGESLTVYLILFLIYLAPLLLVGFALVLRTNRKARSYLRKHPLALAPVGILIILACAFVMLVLR